MTGLISERNSLKINGNTIFLHNFFNSNKEISDVKRLFLLATINSLYLNETRISMTTRISLPVDVRVKSGEQAEHEQL
jgi:hypothetical protein